MANPSLQIGNDNWAIKEDNLLGYSTAGTRFVPQPITMTRATLGTRVNPSGLVEDVALLGSELVTNGDFSNGTTDWEAEGFSSMDVGTYQGRNNVLNVNILNTSTISRIRQPFDYVSGVTYLINVDVYLVSGSFRVDSSDSFVLGNFVSTNTTGSWQTLTAYITASGTGSNYIWLRSSSQISQFYISNISVKEATIDNLPRVDYTDGTSSLLVEPMKTNLVTESSDFTNWTTTGSAEVTPNTTISPDGTQNADTLNIFSGNFFYKPITSGAGTFTLSCYVKVASGTLDFKMQSFNGTDGADASSTFTANTNWQRFEFTTTVTTDSNFYPIQVSGLTGGDFQIWGAQVEEGSYATSYIPTDGGTVTRVQETYEKTGISDKIGQTEGTFFIELSKPVLSPDNYITISLNNAASNSIDNTLTIGFKNSNEYYIRLRAGGTSAFTSGNTASLANTFYKIAVSYKSTESLIYIDGSPITPNGGNLSNAFAFTATLDNLSFDLDGDNTSPFYGNVKQLQIFKTALSPSELTTLTT